MWLVSAILDTIAAEVPLQPDLSPKDESASMGPIVQRGVPNHWRVLKGNSVEVKHYQHHQVTVQLDSFVKMALRQTDPQMALLEMNVQLVRIVRLGVLLPHLVLQEHTQMPLGIDKCKTVLTALVGITVKELVIQSPRISVMQDFTVHLDRKCVTPMVLSAPLGIFVQLVPKNLCDVKVEHIRIIPIKFPVR